MPISEDLKSVHRVLTSMARSFAATDESVIRLACANILSLAEQVETLENMPVLLTSESAFSAPDFSVSTVLQ